MKNQFKNGLDFENATERTLLDLGYLKTNQKRFDHFRERYVPVFCRQYKNGTTVFHRAMVSDFLVYHPEKWPKCLRIECKFQRTTGTAQDKIPKNLEDFKQNAPQLFMLLIGGNGFSLGVSKYLLKQSEEIKNLVGVMNLTTMKKLM